MSFAPHKVVQLIPQHVVFSNTRTQNFKHLQSVPPVTTFRTAKKRERDLGVIVVGDSMILMMMMMVMMTMMVIIKATCKSSGTEQNIFFISLDDLPC